MKRMPWNKRARIAWNMLFGKRPRRSIAYSAAINDRLTLDWNATSGSADDDVSSGLVVLRNRARHAERNDPVTRQYLRLLAANVIGPAGAKLQCQVRNANGNLNKPFNDRIEAGWADWSRKPTTDGKQNLSTFQRMLIKQLARDGEAFVRMWRGFDNTHRFALQVIDPALVDEGMNITLQNGNRVRLGIETDSFERMVAIHVRMPNGQPAQRIPGDEIIHLFDMERANQCRGVSWMASVLLPGKMLDGYIEAELVAARVSASKMGFFQRKEGGVPADPDDESGEITTEANPGTFGILPEGYELSQWTPDHPAAAFGQFVKDSMRRISIGHGVSYNALASDLESVNYSSLRSGMVIERDVWRIIQDWWESVFLRVVYENWLNMALLAGTVTLDNRDHRKFLATRWTPRGWMWVDPLKDVQASVMALQNGLTSRQMVLAEQGVDFETVLEQIADEQALAEQYGVKLGSAALQPTTEVDDSGDSDNPEPNGNGNGNGRSRLPLTAGGRWPRN